MANEYRSETNLMTQINAVRARAAEAEISGSPVYLTNDQIAQFIYDAELHIAINASDDALFTLTREVTHTISGGQVAMPRGNETSPQDDEWPCLRVLAVIVDGTQAHIVESARFREIARNSADRAGDKNPYAAIIGQNIDILPADASPGSVLIRYVAVPRRRFMFHEGSVTAHAANTQFTDSAQPFADGYFNRPTDARVFLRWTSGDELGSHYAVTGPTANVIAVDPNLLAASGYTGNTYEVGDASDLGEGFASLVTDYATFLALSANKEAALANQFLTIYWQSLQSINARYADLHRVEPSRKEAR